MRTKVALCLWGDRIAPRYDRSQMVRIVTLEGNTVVHETTIAADHLEPTSLATPWPPRSRRSSAAG
jgi:hypothetical protein